MKQKWSKEKIVETIQELRKKNIDISASNISKNYISLFTSACSKRYFSSWANAVKTAGIDYEQILKAGKNRRREKVTKWSKELILEELRRLESKSLLTTYREKSSLYSAARRKFGSWKQALETAGHHLTKGTHKNSKRFFRSEGLSNGRKN